MVNSRGEMNRLQVDDECEDDKEGEGDRQRKETQMRAMVHMTTREGSDQ